MGTWFFINTSQCHLSYILQYRFIIILDA